MAVKIASRFRYLRLYYHHIIEFIIALVISLTCWIGWVNCPSLPWVLSDQIIKPGKPNPQLVEKFNNQAVGEWVRWQKGENIFYEGYKTANREFLKDVIQPIVASKIEELWNLNPVEKINQLALGGVAIFQTYIGKNFYREGGDLLDLDDPSDSGIRFNARYGLDDVGLVTLPFELAVHLGLLAPTASGMELSSKGFFLYAQRQGIPDKGGRFDGNRYRVDLEDLQNLGRKVLVFEQQSKVKRKYLTQLQPGDILVSNNHCGIVVRINRRLYYLESGGWILSRYNFRPVALKTALQWLIARGNVEVIRTLPAEKKMR